MYIDTTQNGTKWHGLFLQVQLYAYTLNFVRSEQDQVEQIIFSLRTSA